MVYGAGGFGADGPVVSYARLRGDATVSNATAWRGGLAGGRKNFAGEGPRVSGGVPRTHTDDPAFARSPLDAPAAARLRRADGYGASQQSGFQAGIHAGLVSPFSIGALDDSFSAPRRRGPRAFPSTAERLRPAAGTIPRLTAYDAHSKIRA
jgi:hypothetical protein